MKAPDKIYLHKIRDEGSSGFYKMWFEQRARCVPSEEYIRKDALLEWAKETYLSENASAIRKVCFKQLVEKLISM